MTFAISKKSIISGQVDAILKSLFNAVSSRIDAWNQVSPAFEALPRQRAVSLLDIEFCFTETNMRLLPGQLAGGWAEHRKLIHAHIDYLQKNDVIFGDTLRTTRALDKTLDNLRIFTYGNSRDLILEKFPEFSILYLGDYMDVFEGVCANPEGRAKLDCVLGNGDAAIKILNNLRTLPDYSQYVSSNNHRPPPNTPKNPDKVKAPFWQPANTPA